MRTIKLLAALVLLHLLAGCASIMTSNENQVRVETVDASGKEVKDAICTVLRGDTRTSFNTPAVVPIAKGSGDIRMDCTKTGVPEGKAVLMSRVGAATFGNIIAGGVVGAVVDQATGKAYNFPEWVQIVMGQFLVFDRRDHNDGKPTPGKALETTAQPAEAPK
jgi:hypothetical protein